MHCKKILKFADDLPLICLTQDGDESAYIQEVEEVTVWCSHDNLEQNTLETVETIDDFRRKPQTLPPLTIVNSTVTTVESFRFLGATISKDLKCNNHIDSVVEKRPAEVGLPLSAEEVQPASAVLLYSHSV